MRGAAAMLAAITQGPISTIVLMMELTGQARAAAVPMLLIVATATLVAAPSSRVRCMTPA